jgi:hypothetical protein
MPEMLRYGGRRFVVDKRAEKICDTIHYTGSRRLRDAVLLEDLRCDGSAHDGCQAECRLFWKESWLRRIGPGELPSEGRRDEGADAALAQLLARHTRQTTEIDGQRAESYRCQATELHRASQHVRVGDPRPYLREYTSGNASLGRFLRVTARAALQEPLRKLGLMPEIPLSGSRTASAPEPSLGLQRGDWVQVKTREEIADTLNPKGRNRGLWFDREMLPYCGGIFRVRQRVSRFIDDRNGGMIDLKTDCVTLERVVCSGDRSLRRWFCPRAIYPFWRESWLRRVAEPPTSAVEGSGSPRGATSGSGPAP